MDLNNLKNLDVKDLIEKLKSLDLTRDKKALTKFGIGFGAVFIFLFFYYVLVAPKINEQKVRIDIMKENQQNCYWSVGISCFGMETFLIFSLPLRVNN